MRTRCRWRFSVARRGEGRAGHHLVHRPSRRRHRGRVPTDRRAGFGRCGRHRSRSSSMGHRPARGVERRASRQWSRHRLILPPDPADNLTAPCDDGVQHDHGRPDHGASRSRKARRPARRRSSATVGSPRQCRHPGPGRRVDIRQRCDDPGAPPATAKTAPFLRRVTDPSALAGGGTGPRPSGRVPDHGFVVGHRATNPTIRVESSAPRESGHPRLAVRR